MKHGQEKSDLFVVAKKPANKPGRLGAELVEPRKRTKGNMVEQHTCRTLRRASVTPRLNCVRQSCSRASSLITQGGSPVREIRPPGSVRGVPSNGHSYRDKVSDRKGIANQTGPESCVAHREVRCEALTGEPSGQPLSREKETPVHNADAQATSSLSTKSKDDSDSARRPRHQLLSNSYDELRSEEHTPELQS